MLACACIISTVLGWELLNKCGETQFNSDKFLGEMGYVLGEPASVRQNSLRSVAVSLHEHSISPSSVGILSTEGLKPVELAAVRPRDRLAGIPGHDLQESRWIGIFR